MTSRYFLFRWKNKIYYIDAKKLKKNEFCCYYYVNERSTMIIYFTAINENLLIIDYVLTPKKFYTLPRYDFILMDEATRKIYSKCKGLLLKPLSEKQYENWRYKNKFETSLFKLSEFYIQNLKLAFSNGKFLFI